jgi:hypothetical protein
MLVDRIHDGPSIGSAWVSRHHPGRGFIQGDPAFVTPE